MSSEKENKIMESIKKMVEFLTGHFRYSTMNSWNGSYSYAANVKIDRRPELKGLDNAYEMLGQEDAFFWVNDRMADFARRHEYRYQMGFNGRSGGYIVLYRGGTKPSEYKSRCTECGQRNYKSLLETNGDATCGKCGAKKGRVNFTPPPEVYTMPGQSIGSKYPEDYAEMSAEDVRAEYKLVKDFDKTVKACCEAFADFCRDNEVVEEEVRVVKTVKTTRPRL
jgi:hypothetical protein